MSIKTMAIAASGLQAQRIRLQAISANMANINTTRGPGGEPYQRLVPIFRPETLENGFHAELADQRQLYAVRVEKVAPADREPLWVYNPDHPDADENGYVGMPNINVVEEMTDMLNAARSYEANMAALQTAKQMAKQAIDVGKG
ncbi:MAG: flagellar basal body rod protein FlgC [Candidatus Lernaella stagnicola]|nr:flagellar basal body rod protein FlgC [Candidatus Lernaella stagnicola]